MHKTALRYLPINHHISSMPIGNCPLPSPADRFSNVREVTAELRREGFSIQPGARLQSWLGPHWLRWNDFAASWNDLEEDNFMADGGRYRCRRYAVFEVTGTRVCRAPHQPHFQARIYNHLNGDLERWFAPVTPEIGSHPITEALVRHLATVFEALIPSAHISSGWHVEYHQFRIKAGAGLPGRPTPEGIHRDGVDGAFVMLIDRNNVASGVTEIFDPDGKSFGSFTLTNPGDAVILDDRRVFHGVTPITPLDHGKAATRDVLVITFTNIPGAFAATS